PFPGDRAACLPDVGGGCLAARSLRDGGRSARTVPSGTAPLARSPTPTASIRAAQPPASPREQRRERRSPQRTAPRQVHVRQLERVENTRRLGQRRLLSDGPHRVGERAIESRFRQASEAVAELLARSRQLVAGEPGGGPATRALDRLAQAVLVLPGRARRDHGDGPAAAVLDGRADVGPEPPPPPHPLEQPGGGASARE